MTAVLDTRTTFHRATVSSRNWKVSKALKSVRILRCIDQIFVWRMSHDCRTRARNDVQRGYCIHPRTGRCQNYTRSQLKHKNPWQYHITSRAYTQSHPNYQICVDFLFSYRVRWEGFIDRDVYLKGTSRCRFGFIY